jgi:phosphotransferase system enzyme I (PtsI)
VTATLIGIGASPGSAAGPVFVASPSAASAVASGEPLVAARVAAERAARRLERLAAERRASAPNAADVLEAQALLVRDEALHRSVAENLEAGRPLGDAIAAAADGYAAQLEALEDDYLRARAADVREAGRLLLAELAGSGASRLTGLEHPSVVVAEELAPADLLSVPPELLLAVVTETGGPQSHAAIVARELGVPAVVAVTGAVAAAAAFAAVDGGSGMVRFSDRLEAGAVRTSAARLDLAGLPVRLMANAGSVAAARAAAAAGAHGIGLFRTEFLYLGRDRPPTEEEQTETYAQVCAALDPHPVLVRTLDAGSDKALSYLPQAVEPNPALGRRGIRLWLDQSRLHGPQIRALIGVARDHPNLQVMLPMVGSRAEVEAARALFTAEAEAQRARLPRLGIMVELPAVAAALDAFAGLIDFASLGTNDLGQYALGADRELSWDAELGDFHPGLLRLIRRAVDLGREIGIEVGVCGEMAGEPSGARFLVGCGASSLSMATGSLAAVAAALRRADLQDLRRRAEAATAEPDAARARAHLNGGFDPGPDPS